MFNRDKSPVRTDLFEPDQIVADKNSNPAIGGVDWLVESSRTNPANEVKDEKVRMPRFNPSKRMEERVGKKEWNK